MRIQCIAVVILQLTAILLLAAENVGTTNDGGLKVGTGPRPTPKPGNDQVLVPIPTDPANSPFGEPAKPAATPAKKAQPASDVLSRGSSVLKGTFTFDFDSGQSSGEGDLFWNHRDDVARFLVPRNGALVARIDRARFDDVTREQLQALDYSTSPINCSDNGDNELRRGTVLAIKTDAGHFAKMRVTSYGYDLGIEWVTYK